MDENEQPTVPIEPVGSEGGGAGAGESTPAAASGVGSGAHPAPAYSATAYSAPASGPAYAGPAPAAPGEPFLRRHSVAIAIVAAVLAVIVIAGGTAWGVSAAVASSQTAAPASVGAAHAAAGKAGKSARKRAAHAAVGTIASISGDSWTLHTASGATMKVTTTSSTTFGTKADPSTMSSFAVGDRVAVLGQRHGTDVTATRVVHLPLKQGAATPAPSPTAGS